MAEEIFIDKAADKKSKYVALIPQIKALCEGEDDFIANSANLIAALKQAFGFFWIGLYFVKGNELVLGPFQGSVACTRIQKGKGVCGAAWEKRTTIIVDDVDAFPGHIACSSLSKSEIVVPVFNDAKEVIMVLDIDSDQLSDFDTTDQHYLEEIAVFIAQLNHNRV